MRSLIDRPPTSACELLRGVAEGYAAAGTWPIWQYVLLRLNRTGGDGDATVRTLGQWPPHGYKTVFWPGSLGASAPEPDQPIRLTVYGMFHSDHAAVRDLASAFVEAVLVAASRYAAFEPSPTEVVPLILNGTDLAAEANERAGTDVSPAELCEILAHEPATWTQIRVEGDSFTWDLTHSPVHRFRDIGDPRDYLIALSDFFGTAAVARPARLHLTALPDALDRLDLAWQLAFGHRLLAIHRAALPVELTEPVAEQEDFKSRCSALADVLRTLQPRPIARNTRGDSLARIARCIQELPGEHHAALEATTVLEKARDVRDRLQHSSARAKYEPSWVALGLDGFGDDWPGRWEHLRRVVVRALDSIADELLAQREADATSEEGA